jgi:hypothetical protein
MRVQTILGQGIPDLSYDGSRPAQYVRGCEAEQPDISQQQAILPTIVLDEAGTVRLAVVFETKPVFAVIKVWPSKKGTSSVSNCHLYLGTGEPVQHEQHSKACLHRRFRRGFGKFQHEPHRANAFPSGVAFDPFGQLSVTDQARMKGHVCDDHCVNQAQLPAKVRQRSHKRCRPKTPPSHHLTIVQSGSTHADTTPCPAFAVPRHNCFDGLAWRNVEAMQPGRRLS